MMTPVRTPPARYTRTDNNGRRRERDAFTAHRQVDDAVRAAIVVRLRRVSGGRERRAVEDARGFVADLLEHAADRAVVFRDAFLAGRVGGLADAGDQGERTVQRPNDVADTDAVGRPRELIAAVRPFAALDEAPVFETQQDVFEEFLGDCVSLGEVADEHRPMAVLPGQRQHRLQSVFASASQHVEVDKVYSFYRLLVNCSTSGWD